MCRKSKSDVTRREAWDLTKQKSQSANPVNKKKATFFVSSHRCLPVSSKIKLEVRERERISREFRSVDVHVKQEKCELCRIGYSTNIKTSDGCKLQKVCRLKGTWNQQCTSEIRFRRDSTALRRHSVSPFLWSALRRSWVCLRVDTGSQTKSYQKKWQDNFPHYKKLRACDRSWSFERSFRFQFGTNVT